MNRRPLLGVLSLILLAIGFAIWVAGAETMMGISGPGVRVGVLLGTVWLAYPDLKRIPAWFSRVLLVALCVIVVRPKAALFAVPLILAIWFLRPRHKAVR